VVGDLQPSARRSRGARSGDHKPRSRPCRMLRTLWQPPRVTRGCAWASPLAPSLPFSRGDHGLLQPPNRVLFSCSGQLQTGRWKWRWGCPDREPAGAGVPAEPPGLRHLDLPLLLSPRSHQQSSSAHLPVSAQGSSSQTSEALLAVR